MATSDNPELLTEYEAALLTGMSPRLLKWLCSYAPKSGNNRKLILAKKVGKLRYYTRAELLDFNAWLDAPWPSEKGKRPSIPSGIKKEIKIESNGECALCQGSKDVCEAAHIEPVASSKNNHPRNLIWLCSNHHTKFDKGLYECHPKDRDIIRTQKKMFAYYAKIQWEMQSKSMVGGLLLMKAIAKLSDQMESAKSKELATLETKAESVIALIPKMAPLSHTDPLFEDYENAKTALKEIVKTGSVKSKLRRAKKVRTEFIANAGYVTCFVCDGSGYRDDRDCPVCDGEKQIPEDFAENLDVSPYEKVDCPVCEGAGARSGQRCDVCDGEREMDRRFADRIDPKDYQEVSCPLCEGKGYYDDRDCDVCAREGVVEPRNLEYFDSNDYAHHPCPVCKKTGYLDGLDCHACDGEGSMQKRYLDELDLSDYEDIDCPVCNGSNIWGDLDECPACQGKRQMAKRYADKIDVTNFEWITCQACEGTGEGNYGECPKCLSGNVMRRNT